MKKPSKGFSNKSLQMFFKVFNERYFGKKIPAMRVRFGKIKDEGHFRQDRIIINSLLRKFPDLASLVLLHEMNHAYLEANGYNGIMDGGHSIVFHVGIDRLYKAGAYEGIL
jgi:hypothetical protein